MANAMTLLDFLGKLMDHFPGGLTKEKSTSVISTYQDILTEEINKTKCEYDFRKLFHYVLKNYKFKNYPTAADLIEWLPQGEKREYQEFLYDDGLIRLRLKDGRVYDFVKAKNQSLREIKSFFQKKHTSVQPDGGVYCEIESLKYVPSNYSVMMNKAFDNITGESLDEKNWTDL